MVEIEMRPSEESGRLHARFDLIIYYTRNIEEYLVVNRT